MNENNMVIRPCPFCGSTDIRYSVKNAPDRVDLNSFEHFYRYYVAMYCNTCHSYGSRVLVDTQTSTRKYSARLKIETEPQYQSMAIKAWNNRKQ